MLHGLQRRGIQFNVSSQVMGMVRNVIGHEAGHKVVTVVMARLHAQGQRMPCGLACSLQALGLQLRVQKLVVSPLVNQPGQT